MYNTNAAAQLPPKVPVLGVDISATNYGEVLRLCRTWAERRRGREELSTALVKASGALCIFVCTVNAVMTAVLRSEYKSVLNAGDIATTDGMPLAWALRSFGVRGQPRVYGPDLMLALCGQATRLGHRIFLFGGREDVIPVTCRKLTQRFPGLNIVGTYAQPDPPQTGEEKASWIETVTESGADIVFVGFGQPRQEEWILQHRDKLSGLVMIGVGAAFDFHAGRVRQAPPWMQSAGLEWFFRLVMEPKRLWRRYVLLNPLFLAMWGLQLAGILRYRREK